MIPKFRALYKPDNKIYPVQHMQWMLDQSMSLGLISEQEVIFIAPPETFERMQWTGLVDKNKVEIFTQDYLLAPNGMIYLVTWDGSLTRMCNLDCSKPIALRSNGALLKSKGISESYSDDWISSPQLYEVIGNKFETELLEGAERE